MNFEDFQLDSCFLSNVRALGYVAPTPIQEQAIPPVKEGRDVMGLAQTGTGKTAAFLLPILNRLKNEPHKGPRPRCLVIAPTRELAEQILDSARDLGRNTGLRYASIYGGVGYAPQIQKLRSGLDVVVACPGRLLDHLDQGNVDLSAVQVLVLDEADHMFDMGFLPTIRKILAKLPAERQTLLFSATMPEDIRRLAQDILRDPVTVRVGQLAPVETVSHAAYPVPQHLKTPLLLELLQRNETGSVLVFTRTKHRARRVGEQLAKAGHKAASIQGNLSQNKRQAALDGFRSGAHRILVATDIAARGIDVSLVAHVVNYDVPDTADAYTHRIGRTGRAERTGDAVTFVTPEDGAMIRAIEHVLRKPLARKTLEGFDYSVPRPAKDTEFARPPLQPRGRRAAPVREDKGSEKRGEKRPAKRSDHQPEKRAEQPRSEARQRRPERGPQGAEPRRERPRHEAANREDSRREGGRRDGQRREGQPRDRQPRAEARTDSPRIGYSNRKRPWSSDFSRDEHGQHGQRARAGGNRGEANGNVAPRSKKEEPNGNVLEPRPRVAEDRYDDAPRVAPRYDNR